MCIIILCVYAEDITHTRTHKHPHTHTHPIPTHPHDRGIYTSSVCALSHIITRSSPPISGHHCRHKTLAHIYIYGYGRVQTTLRRTEIGEKKILSRVNFNIIRVSAGHSCAVHAHILLYTYSASVLTPYYYYYYPYTSIYIYIILYLYEDYGIFSVLFSSTFHRAIFRG